MAEELADRDRRMLLICGSLRAGSTNEALLRTVASLLPDDVVAELYDGWLCSPTSTPTTTTTRCRRK